MTSAVTSKHATDTRNLADLQRAVEASGRYRLRPADGKIAEWSQGVLQEGDPDRPYRIVQLCGKIVAECPTLKDVAALVPERDDETLLVEFLSLCGDLLHDNGWGDFGDGLYQLAEEVGPANGKLLKSTADKLRKELPELTFC